MSTFGNNSVRILSFATNKNVVVFNPINLLVFIFSILLYKLYKSKEHLINRKKLVSVLVFWNDV